MIVSILTVVGMVIGVLIEALLGGPSASTPTSGGTSGGDKKGGAREWIKNKLKALSQLLGKLADKALASLPGIIGSIISWILNRAKEVVDWLSQNLWALITLGTFKAWRIFQRYGNQHCLSLSPFDQNMIRNQSLSVFRTILSAPGNFQGVDLPISLLKLFSRDRNLNLISAHFTAP